MKNSLYATFYDSASSVVALYFSFVLRFGTFAPELLLSDKFQLSFLAIVITQSVLFYFLDLQKGLWRFTSLIDVIKVAKAAFIAVLASIFFVFIFNRLDMMPRTVFVIDWILLTSTLCAGRIISRIRYDKVNSLNNNQSGFEKVIIVGAGAAGERLIRDFLRNPNMKMRIAGLVDDDISKQNKQIHGMQVLGKIDDLEAIIPQFNVQKVFIAIPTATSKTITRIVERCKGLNVTVKTLPKITDLLNGKVELSQLRNITPEDVLGREEVLADRSLAASEFQAKRIMITGAGGSIGSEICIQLAKLNPQLIILYEITEHSLYSIELELNDRFPNLSYISVLGDIRDKSKLESTINKFSPSIIFHAAAYKHVPMVEKNPTEGLKTNILGTKILTEVALSKNIEKFVMISTDKAVNPTNIMGATKRVAEQVVQRASQTSSITNFATVRFGNVLGSSGSVIPLFKRQIAAGGPITVTHEDIERYFMSISEAARLVLEACILSTGSEVFVLEMGKPIKILDLAKKMISLSGLDEGSDIEIKITGLRPGEKLFEELLADKEQTLPTPHPKIRIASARQVTSDFDEHLNALINYSDTDGIDHCRELLKRAVPEYVPKIIPENNIPKNLLS